MQGKMAKGALFVVLAAIVLGGTSAWADIITLTNGKVLKGVAKFSAEDPSVVIFIGPDGRMNLPRNRVANIEEENEAMGWIHIGLVHRSRKQFPLALQDFQKALELGTDDALATQYLNETQQMIGQENKLNREQTVARIDEMADEVRKAIDMQNFAKAEEILGQVDGLVPDEDQKTMLRQLVSKLYLAWAQERADKFDPIGQEEMLNKALAADPENVEILDKMLEIWENDDTKMDQVANVYEMMLEQNPQDRVLRAKLATIYDQLRMPEDVVRHDLILYKEEQMEDSGAVAEDRLIKNVNTLHRRYAGEGDFEKAIYYAKLEQSINPDVDPLDLHNYEFMQFKRGLDLKQPGDQLKLAVYAEEHGMFNEALESYRFVLTKDEENPEALAAIYRFANRDLKEAQLMFRSGQWSLAMALAEQVKRQYPEATEVSMEAMKIIGSASIEIEKDRRARKEQAREILDQANIFYETAERHFNSLFDEERSEIPSLSNPRNEARRYYQLALEAYEQVIDIDSSYESSSSIVTVRIAECKKRLRSLNRSAQPSRTRFE